MTGRDLIVYILEHHLEDEPVFKDGRFIGFLTVGEVAEVLDVGVSTVRTLATLDRIEYIIDGGRIYIPANFKVKEETCVEE